MINHKNIIIAVLYTFIALFFGILVKDYSEKIYNNFCSGTCRTVEVLSDEMSKLPQEQEFQIITKNDWSILEKYKADELQKSIEIQKKPELYWKEVKSKGVITYFQIAENYNNSYRKMRDKTLLTSRMKHIESGKYFYCRIPSYDTFVGEVLALDIDSDCRRGFNEWDFKE